jgi:phage shock protein A
MSLINRIYATVSARVDRVVSEIENHDAVVESAIRDNQQSLARAKVRFNRLQTDGRRIQQRLENLRTAEQQWCARARNNAEGDEQIALQCLKKRRECRQQIATLENALSDHINAEGKLSRDMSTIEERLREINQQRNLMRTRESTAEAMRTFNSIKDYCGVSIDDTFEKWETRVLEAELASGNLECTDELEERFIEEEEIEDLRLELDAIRKGETT